MPIYQDALLYNTAKTKGIQVIGIEGKGLAHSKESPYYHQAREEYMAKQLVKIIQSGKDAVFPVGSAHINNLIKLLGEQGFCIESNNEPFTKTNLITLNFQHSAPAYVLPEIQRLAQPSELSGAKINTPLLINDNSNNKPAPLMIEDESYIKPQSKTKISVNFNDLLYKSTISFKSLDFMVDTFRFINEPSVENVQKTLRDVVHLQSILGENNMYSMALSFIDITDQLYKGELQEAGVQAITTIAYMALPTMLSFTGIPYLGFAYGTTITAYTGYHAINNVYSLYNGYNTVEWQLKSALAYKDLYEVLANSPLQYTYDFASNVKWYEIKANSIKLEIEKAQIKQHLETKGEFGNKLYDYIYGPMLEEKYSLLNKIISGELTEEQAAALKAKHVSMTIGEQYYQHCISLASSEESDDYYNCYNMEQEILDHVVLGEDGVVHNVEKL